MCGYVRVWGCMCGGMCGCDEWCGGAVVGTVCVMCVWGVWGSVLRGVWNVYVCSVWGKSVVCGVCVVCVEGLCGGRAVCV